MKTTQTPPDTNVRTSLKLSTIEIYQRGTARTVNTKLHKLPLQINTLHNVRNAFLQFL